jgi:hypothetical protein
MTMTARACITGAVLVAAGCSVPCVDDGLLSMQHDQSCAQATMMLTTTGTLPSMVTLEPPPSTTLTTDLTDTTATTTTTGTATDSDSSGGSTGAAHCFNDVPDGTESDLDCGGPDCAPCNPGFECDGDPNNCVSDACNSGVVCIDPQLCTLPMGIDLLFSPQDNLGAAVDVVPDVNDDGIDDILVSAWGASPRTFVIHGDPSLDSGFDFDALESGQGGFVIHGMPQVSAFAPAGDFNGDGIGDFAIGDGLADVAYIVFGRDDAPPVPPLQLPNIALEGGGVRFSGDGVGTSLAGGLDVDGDGQGDLVIGAPSEPESTYVVFSRPGLTDHSAMDVGTTVEGFQITSQLIVSGRDVALLPDLNGDGRAEVVVAAPNFLGETGRVFVVFGKDDFGKVDLNEDSPGFYGIGSNAVKLTYFGQSVAAAGDVDGDGLHDIIASTTDSEVFVVFGKAADGDIDIDALGAAGFKIVVSGGNGGFLSVGGGSDINGDGLADLLVGAPYINPQTLWVVFGKSTPGDVLTANVESGVGGFPIRLPGANAGFGESFGVGDPLDRGWATAAIGAPNFMADEGTIQLVTLGLCP